MKVLYFYILFATIACSCEKDKKQEYELYDGPIVTMRNIDMLVTDSAIVKLRLIAKTQLELQNKDREFPDGIFLKFYNKFGKVSSTLEANTGYFYSEKNYYKAEGNVLMKNLLTDEELSTELLNWLPEEEKIKTDNFVTIKTDDEVLTGEGLEASQDFEEYTILKPSGTMSVLPSSPQPIYSADKE